ncbi:rhomboid family intramembrane serine protease [Rehaibacterium terrae]|jgi:membrane associated rhomboid family serine protease|uniref:Membrane associated rhomboid family serine protease n=1 Tax=Rehaibacterium terrae TaxID=1341696 RepID=A0A7W7V915_9GAMM|nr:rhomboid family intramembrane serine protease [Rehaibacterium terrae]MBB5014644.1 membrane associated rhomboid family serine protease [Rehaibacterium terrae]
MFLKVPSRRPPPPRWASPLLVLLCMAGFFWLVSLDGEAARRAMLLRWGAVSGALPATPAEWWEALTGGRLLSLLTALFVHADWSHLLGNMLFLVIFGLPAERATGPWRFLLLYLLGGALANLAAAALMDAPNRVIVGASGAVSAVIGAYLALFPRARLGIVVPLGLFLEFVRAPASLLIGIWALLQLLFTFVGPAFGAVAWWAHLAGFIFGVIFAMLSRPAIARRLRAH